MSLLLRRTWTKSQVSFNIFRTTSQGLINPSIITSDSSLTSWIVGDDIPNLLWDNSPSYTYIDAEAYHDISIFGIDFDTITEIDFINSSLVSINIDELINLESVLIQDNYLTSTEIDDVLLNLDDFGILNGVLNYSNNPGETGLLALDAYNNLIAKGWIITGIIPSASCGGFPYTFPITFGETCEESGFPYTFPITFE